MFTYDEMEAAYSAGIDAAIAAIQAEAGSPEAMLQPFDTWVAGSESIPSERFPFHTLKYWEGRYLVRIIDAGEHKPLPDTLTEDHFVQVLLEAHAVQLLPGHSYLFAKMREEDATGARA